MGSDPPHYFRTPGPGAAGPLRELPVTLAGRELVLRVTGGVFSGERLDPGTGVLLRHVPRPPASGDLLDLGCGWGPLAIAMGLQSPEARVWAVDVNRLALELTARNARLAGVGGVRAVTPDEVPDDVRFGAIWSNPPIRVGKAELHSLLLRWIPRLVPGADAYLVVGRNLGADSLQRWLTEALEDPASPGCAGSDGGLSDGGLSYRAAGEGDGGEWSVQRIGSAKGYRVLRVRAPAG